MSAQPVHRADDDPRVPAIARSIQAVGNALSSEKRLAFYAEVLGAEAGEPINLVIETWWREAMLDQLPGRAERLADALARRGGVTLDELAARAGGLD
ncbi:hypothetical protein [Streptacidiphilus melanogenes]|uniref:hypothetical protein n=1 Tax=Streptacidiphilus melanogenes TaxID=411235 RepID=UPI0005A9CA24|nr:hypothetical protein [Streptacidiphilus melanogenes]